MGNRIVKYLYRNVSVKAETVKKVIDQLDIDEDGRLTLGEVAVGLKELWRVAMGKTKPSRKQRKIRVVD